MGGHELATTPNQLPTTIQITYDYFGDEDACLARPEAAVVYGTTMYPEDAGILVYDRPGRDEGQIVFYAFDYGALTSDQVAKDLLENTLEYLTGGAQAVPETPGTIAVRLGRPHPAITTGATRLSLSLAAVARARVAVYDTQGRRVRVLADGELGAGVHVLTWDGRGADGNPSAGGVYFIRSVAGDEQVTRRVVVMN
jgi:hypothetical protein